MPPYETLAYSNRSAPQDKIAYFMYHCRRHATGITILLIFVGLLTIFTSEEFNSSSSTGGGLRNVYSSSSSSYAIKHWGGAAHPGYFTSQDAIVAPNLFKFACVTDLDQLSKTPGSGEKPTFQSHLQPGVLSYDPSSNKYSTKIDPEEQRTLISAHNEEGRGMELSELTLYNDRLLSFDDRTGSIFEILSDGVDQSFVVPRFVITEGEGDTDKGMKWEWATTKDGSLYIGSMGKEYTRSDGSIANTNNLWISIISAKGELHRVDWMDNYNFVRELLDASAPGYVIHEAVLWSPSMKKWIFLPRRISQEKYDDVLDEKKGAKKAVLVNDSFTSGEVIDIQFSDLDSDPLHGFSTAAFVPGTKDRHIAALRSVEEDCVGGDESLCKQRTYMTVFDVTSGEVLMDEVKMSEDMKFEGLEFVDVTKTAMIS